MQRKSVFFCSFIFLSFCSNAEEVSLPVTGLPLKSQTIDERATPAPDALPEIEPSQPPDSAIFPGFCFQFDLDPGQLGGYLKERDFHIRRQIPGHIPTQTPVALRREALASDFHPRLPLDRKITNAVRSRLFSPQTIKPTGEIGLSVGFEKDVSLSMAREIIERHGAVYEGEIKLLNVVLVSVLPADLERFEGVKNEEKVRWVSTWPLPLSPNNDRVRRVSGVDRMRLFYPGYDGSGVVAGIYDGGTVCQHLDFDSRLTIGVGEDGWCATHSTHVAGILGGSGLMSEDWGQRVGQDIAPFQFQGIAPGVEIISYALDTSSCGWSGCLYNDSADIEQDFENLILTYDVDSTSMSLVSNIKLNWEPCEWLGDTCLASILMDTITGGWAFGRELIHNQSAGNENSPYSDFRCHRGYGTFGTPAAGMKNSKVDCSVDEYGAPTDFTSWGPSDDGRIGIFGGILGQDVWSTVWEGEYDEKSGTSMSAPAMHGIDDLLIQAFYQKFGERPTPALVKAILANSMEEATSTPLGPDFQCGFGYVSEFSTLEAIETIHQGRFIEDVISHGEEITYLMVVPKDTPEVRVTIAWRDEPGSIERQELNLPQLVQDIDISLENPRGRVYHPLVPDPENPDNDATEKEDHLNNIEQVVINAPGRCYLLRVKGYNLPAGPQRFAIAYSGIYRWPPPLPPPQNYLYDVSDKFPAVEPIISAP